MTKWHTVQVHNEPIKPKLRRTFVVIDKEKARSPGSHFISSARVVVAAAVAAVTLYICVCLGYDDDDDSVDDVEGHLPSSYKGWFISTQKNCM